MNRLATMATRGSPSTVHFCAVSAFDRLQSANLGVAVGVAAVVDEAGQVALQPRINKQVLRQRQQIEGFNAVLRAA